MVRLQWGQFYSACNPTTLCACILLWAVRRRAGQEQLNFACNTTTLCVCFLLWSARGCAGLYFYAYDYSSWTSTVMIFRNTSISREAGLLQLNPYTNATVGRALYKTTFELRNSTNGSMASFNTSFVFSMNTDRGKEYFGDGFAFLICPNPFRGEDLQVSSGGYLGMFNSSTNGLLRNRVFAVEFDTHQNVAFKDPNDNHIGVDVNSVVSLKTNNLTTLGIILNEGKKIICWIDYDGGQRYLRVYLAHSPSNKPSSPAIAMALNLAPYIKDNMYVGFTSATGTRAELHTIYSWWFLSGFGKLTLPVSPSGSSRPLASLGRRSIVFAIFSLGLVVAFLCFVCIYAWRRWQKQSKHLIDILLPVACWVYWKESITCEVRSTRCLKLALPTVELLAWLWRTRLVRKHDQPQVKTWPEIFLKRKMGPHYRGEAWQLEDKRRKRRKPHGAVHVKIYEEPVGKESSVDEGNTRRKVKVIKHARMRHLLGREAEKLEVIGRKEVAIVAPVLPVEQDDESKSEGNDRPALKADGLASAILKAGTKGKGSDKGSTSYIIGSDSFIVLEEESELFQRRGSFLIPQGAPGHVHQLASEPAKDVPAATVPVVATPQARGPRPRREVAGPSRLKVTNERLHPQMETLYISTDDQKGDIFSMRRGSFSVHPEDVVNFTGARNGEGGGIEPSVQYLVEHDVDSNSKRGVVVRRGSFMMSTVEHDVESNSDRGLDVRRGSFMIVDDAGSSKLGASDQTNRIADSRSHDYSQAQDQLPKSPLHPSTSGDDDGTSHVTHRWLFD